MADNHRARIADAIRASKYGAEFRGDVMLSHLRDGYEVNVGGVNVFIPGEAVLAVVDSSFNDMVAYQIELAMAHDSIGRK